jgi:deazaflavin-dependent oxidoreductase (nitroreductase family)
MTERGSRRDPVGEQLAGWGSVALLETRGRISAHPIRTPVGFVEDATGSLLIAAGDAEASWVRNLDADARCRATVGDRSAEYVAEELIGSERNAAIAALILRYGTPAERLGAGPAFRLRPVAEGSGRRSEASIGRPEDRSRRMT